jgi:hypothetical protein
MSDGNAKRLVEKFKSQLFCPIVLEEVTNMPLSKQLGSQIIAERKIMNFALFL